MKDQEKIQQLVQQVEKLKASLLEFVRREMGRLEKFPAWAVVGQPNDLSEPVDSVWTTQAAAEARVAELDEKEKPAFFWSVREFELDRPGQEIN